MVSWIWPVGHSLLTIALKIPIKYKYLEKTALNKCLLVIIKSRSLNFSKKQVEFPDINLHIIFPLSEGTFPANLYKIAVLSTHPDSTHPFLYISL